MDEARQHGEQRPFYARDGDPNTLHPRDQNPHYNAGEIFVQLNGIHFSPIATDAEERAFRKGQLHITSTVPIPASTGIAKISQSVCALIPTSEFIII